MHRLVLLSLLVFFVAAVTRPRTARCPRGWWLDEGVRPDGTYECSPLPPPKWRRSPRGGWEDESADDDGAIGGRVYCTGGSVPVDVDGIAVSCEARH